MNPPNFFDFLWVQNEMLWTPGIHYANIMPSSQRYHPTLPQSIKSLLLSSIYEKVIFVFFPKVTLQGDQSGLSAKEVRNFYRIFEEIYEP